MLLKGSPRDQRALLGCAPDEGPRLLGRRAAGLDGCHLFHLKRAAPAADLERARSAIAPDGMIWVSWPNKSSKVATELTEDVLRELAFPLGLVDVKVCAVTEVWSGLKLVIRKELR